MFLPAKAVKVVTMEERMTRLNRLLVMAAGTAAALAGCYAKGSGVRDGDGTGGAIQAAVATTGREVVW
uniref:Uncharacterized protein n=1 Tax=Oryza glumipatula TaxID=40148 RepID=A0A0E0AKH6_9ORYZ